MRPQHVALARAFGATAAKRAAVGAAVGVATSLVAIHNDGKLGKTASSLTTSMLAPAALLGIAFLSVRTATLGGLVRWGRSPGTMAFGAGAAAAMGVGFLAGTHVGRAADRVLSPEWYAESQARAEAAVETARDYVTRLGFGNMPGVGDLDVKVDRSVISNAFFLAEGWTGREIRMGRTENGRSYADAADVVYHEYAHHVIKALAPGLGHTRAAGALHEGIADSIAAAIDRDDWNIGEDAGRVIRRLDAPWMEGDPAHMQHYHEGKADGGGVHRNATIIGHASYRIAQLIGRDAMAYLHLATLAEHDFTPHTQIKSYAVAMLESTITAYGAGSDAHAAVLESWRAVGIDPAPVTGGHVTLGEITPPRTWELEDLLRGDTSDIQIGLTGG